jgi:hypothetical protein
MNRILLPIEPPHVGVPSGAFKMISEPMVHLVQTVHLSCTDTNTVMKTDRNDIPHDPHHLGVQFGTPKIISKPMVLSAQTVHLSGSRLALSPNRLK